MCENFWWEYSEVQNKIDGKIQNKKNSVLGKEDLNKEKFEKSNKSKFIINNSLAVIKRELVFDDITDAPLHDPSATVTSISRQRYSYILSKALLNTHAPLHDPSATVTSISRQRYSYILSKALLNTRK
ncbi:hypothetical protein Glove_229g151 [Diversispora epigaea]|uniref:Uncharacterized protein n=1 Tax=Diversispora epigaea TaxID=1348612 RepID=A0A397ICW9_9GLOM|nr:hypothetical protein Glove_229g151 [Diversispora epigaea]